MLFFVKASCPTMFVASLAIGFFFGLLNTLELEILYITEGHVDEESVCRCHA